MNLYIFVLFLLLVISQASTAVKYTYNVVAQRYPNQPIISKQQGSQWDWNYNSAAYIDANNNIGLLVRVQNLANESIPFTVGASHLAASSVTFNKDGSVTASQTTLANTFVPNNTTESQGTEDPRIAFMNGVYYMFYTAYDGIFARLFYAITSTPSDPTSWQRLGPVFPQFNWTKSGAALFATPQNGLPQHYLFWGDKGISIAVADPYMRWNDTGVFLIQTRNNSFDSYLVEAGPPPLVLGTGDYLFIYNSARDGYPSAKPGFTLQYNVGYTILSGADPTNILQRSDKPIMSPTLDFEIGNSTSFLTPDVVFLEGLVPDPNGCPASAKNDTQSDSVQCFFGVYGGSDSDLGAVRIIVGWTQVPQGSASTLSMLSALFAVIIMNY